MSQRRVTAWDGLALTLGGRDAVALTLDGREPGAGLALDAWVGAGLALGGREGAALTLGGREGALTLDAAAERPRTERRQGVIRLCLPTSDPSLAGTSRLALVAISMLGGSI